MTLGAGTFNAAVSQATDSTPLYGREFFPGYPQCFGSARGGDRWSPAQTTAGLHLTSLTLAERR
jgi:hypothetical protein